MSQAPIRIAGIEVAPGARGRTELSTLRLATGSRLGIPVEVIHGIRPGPRIWLSAAIHGDELNGIEIIRRVLASVSPRTLSGTLLALPIVNVLGFMASSRYLPDRRDLNRSFPGSARGSMASRLAHQLMKEIVTGCDLGIDLHTGSDDRTNLPQIRGNLRDPETHRLAETFGAPVAIHAGARDGSIRAAAQALGIPVLVFEGGEARRFDPEAIEIGTAGVLRVLEALNMRRGVTPPPEHPRLESFNTEWVRASRSGLARLAVKLGDPVTQGQTVGVIQDAFGEEPARLKAPITGMVVGLCRRPLVNRGDALLNLAAHPSPPHAYSDSSVTSSSDRTPPPSGDRA
jgi:uncharacterized protein